MSWNSFSSYAMHTQDLQLLPWTIISPCFLFSFAVVFYLVAFYFQYRHSRTALQASAEKATTSSTTSTPNLLLGYIKQTIPGFFATSSSVKCGVPPAPEPQEYPTGFRPKTKAERNQLGLYPDYAELSGVPWPEAYVDFDPQRALPRPYRPFRWPYHQTMAMSKLQPDWWLELGNTYISRIAERKEFYRIHGKLVLDSLPGEEVEIACREMMELVVMWLAKRYPRWFLLVEDPDVAGGKILVNKILGTSTELDRGISPLVVLLENVPEDFVLMLPTTTPHHDPNEPPKVEYTLRAGVILTSTGWTLSSKLGRTLYDLHHTLGKVPHYATKMSVAMDRFFSRSLPPAKPIQRGSWSFGIEKALFIPPSDSTHTAGRRVQDPNLRLEDTSLRVDWQTLRRLPISGAVCLNSKAMLTGLAELREEKGVPGLVGKVLREGDGQILAYKGVWHVEHLIIPTMEKWDREQRESGVVDTEWDIGTLEQSPFYEGWEERWRGRQGF